MINVFYDIETSDLIRNGISPDIVEINFIDS